MPQKKPLTSKELRRNTPPTEGAQTEYMDTRSFEVPKMAVRKDEMTGKMSLRFSLSSERAAIRHTWDGSFIEVLGHEPGEIRTERLDTGTAPILRGHDRRDPNNHVGVIRGYEVTDGRLEITDAALSRREGLEGLRQDVEDGILVSTSVGYTVHRFEYRGDDDETGLPVMRAVDWEPLEGSLVDIPVDPSVGVGRSQYFEAPAARDAIPNEATASPTESKETEMPEEKRAAEAAASVDVDAIRAEFAAEQAKRTEGIRSAFALYKGAHASLEAECLADPSVTVESAQRKLLGAAAEASAAPVETKGRVITPGADKSDNFRKGFLEATMFRAGLATPDMAGSEFRGMSFVDAARHFLAINGGDVSGSRMQIVGRALTFHTTSDFTDVLFDAANKSVLKGWDEHEETYPQISSVMSVADFKQNHMIGLSGFSDLDEILESGEYTQGGLVDRRELIQLATYGKNFRLSRKALINDDLQMFNRVAVAMGRAARRKIGDLVYGVLTANALMNEDGIALFDTATHGNLAAAGAAFTSVTAGAARVAMALQLDPNSGAALNIRPFQVIAPVTQEDVIADVLNSTEQTDQANGSTDNQKVRRMNLGLVTDARLDQDSTTAYYFQANPAIYDTINLAFLEGQSSPFMEERDEWDIDGKTWKVRIDAAAAPGDWRTFFKNPGV